MPEEVARVTDGDSPEPKGIVVCHLRLYAAQVQEALVVYYKGYRRYGIRFAPSAEAWHKFKVFMKIYIIAKYNCSETIDPILLARRHPAGYSLLLHRAKFTADKIQAKLMSLPTLGKHSM